MTNSTIEDIEHRRRKIESEIHLLVEMDVTAALAGQPIEHSACVTILGQDLNILSAAIERLRNAG
jgi:hypothetical protein